MTGTLCAFVSLNERVPGSAGTAAWAIVSLVSHVSHVSHDVLATRRLALGKCPGHLHHLLARINQCLGSRGHCLEWIHDPFLACSVPLCMLCLSSRAAGNSAQRAPRQRGGAERRECIDDD